jgi:hypothetical protein
LNHFTFPSTIFTAPFVLGSFREPVIFADYFGRGPVFAHKKTALAMSLVCAV